MKDENVNVEKKPIENPKPVLTGRARSLQNLRPPLKKGERLKGAGHPKGQRNFQTVYREALRILARKNKTTPTDLENEIIANGVRLAHKGDHKFYQDLLDRLHGKPAQQIDVTTKGEPVKGFNYIVPDNK